MTPPPRQTRAPPRAMRREERPDEMNKNALGALLTMLAMFCYASMDAVSKSLVVDYPVGQLMWVRYALMCLFAWFLVRRRGVRAAIKSRRPGLQIVRSLIAVVEGAMF